MAKNKLAQHFTVVIPTYTGEEYLPRCFDSILSQNIRKDGSHFDVVVVIDGPNDHIRRITRDYEEKFKIAGIKLNVHQLPNNEGRFEARLKGAKLASAEHLLFVDDRVTFAEDYFSSVIESGASILLPNVLEAEAKNKINRCLYLLRRLVYDKKSFGTTFPSYFIDENNFEKSPKGTTSLWIPKADFLQACEFLEDSKFSKHISDDTLLLKYIIDGGNTIYKSGQAKIQYNPRSGSWAEIRHIFQRGPKFVDYYLQPGTRFFWPLVTALVVAAAVIVICASNPDLIWWIIGLFIASDFLLAVAASEKPGDITLVFFYPIIGLAFGFGILKGVTHKVVS